MQQKEIIKNLFPGYYRKYDQDMETLADLTKRAKGDERSINEFARACGVSPSTISRLINKKNTTDRLEVVKYCPFCKKRTTHKETK